MATLEATDILNNDPNLASDRGKKKTHRFVVSF